MLFRSLQEFDVEIRDKKGTENSVADHLSRINVSEENISKINEDLPGEQLMQVGRVMSKTPWYADVVNYLVCGIIPSDFTYQQKKKILHDAKFFFWEEPLLFKECADGILRRCIPQEEVQSIIYHCHT